MHHIFMQTVVWENQTIPKKRGQSMIFLVPINALGSIQCFETVGWMTEYTPNLAKTCSYLQTEQIKGKRLSL